MSSIEKQSKEIQTELNKSSDDIETVIDKEQEIPIVITLVQGQSGTLYRNQSSGNGIPDKLLY
jgi:hypothetical protein